MYLHGARLRVLRGTVAESLAEIPQSAEDVKVQLRSQLSQLHLHHTVPPHHPLFPLQNTTIRLIYSIYSYTPYTLLQSINAHPSQVFLGEAVVHLGAGSSCSADRKHAGFLELKQL